MERERPRSSAGGVCRCLCRCLCRGSGAAERPAQGTALKPPRGKLRERLNRSIKLWHREMGFTWWVLHSSSDSCVIPRALGRLIPSLEAHSWSWGSRGCRSCTDKTQNPSAFCFHLCFSIVKIHGVQVWPLQVILVSRFLVAVSISASLSTVVA